ncbi:hypothetical protein C8R45DRAFT_1025931 [Mycena sanguinolenta]|nr:hypothetical protein C8R45DRAFT_1025931 [Mycena sanguinolenta]
MALGPWAQGSPSPVRLKRVVPSSNRKDINVVHPPWILLESSADPSPRSINMHFQSLTVFVFTSAFIGSLASVASLNLADRQGLAELQGCAIIGSQCFTESCCEGLFCDGVCMPDSFFYPTDVHVLFRLFAPLASLTVVPAPVYLAVKDSFALRGLTPFVSITNGGSCESLPCCEGFVCDVAKFCTFARDNVGATCL